MDCRSNPISEARLSTWTLLDKAASFLLPTSLGPELPSICRHMHSCAKLNAGRDSPRIH